MKDLVCVELRKAFGSKMFAASIIIGSALSVATSFINYFTILPCELYGCCVIRDEMV